MNKTVDFDNLAISHRPGSVLEENHYYPYGMLIESLSHSTTDPLNTFKYNGIHFEREGGLNSYIAPFRTLDPTIARWNAVDPMSQFLNPYVSMGGDPVAFNDPLGLEVPLSSKNFSMPEYDRPRKGYLDAGFKSAYDYARSLMYGNGRTSADWFGVIYDPTSFVDATGNYFAEDFIKEVSWTIADLRRENRSFESEFNNGSFWLRIYDDPKYFQDSESGSGLAYNATVYKEIKSSRSEIDWLEWIDFGKDLTFGGGMFKDLWGEALKSGENYRPWFAKRGVDRTTLDKEAARLRKYRIRINHFGFGLNFIDLGLTYLEYELSDKSWGDLTKLGVNFSITAMGFIDHPAFQASSLSLGFLENGGVFEGLYNYADFAEQSGIVIIPQQFPFGGTWHIKR